MTSHEQAEVENSDEQIMNKRSVNNGSSITNFLKSRYNIIKIYLSV